MSNNISSFGFCLKVLFRRYRVNVCKRNIFEDFLREHFFADRGKLNAIFVKSLNLKSF